MSKFSFLQLNVKSLFFFFNFLGGASPNNKPKPKVYSFNSVLQISRKLIRAAATINGVKLRENPQEQDGEAWRAILPGGSPCSSEEFY